MNDSLPAELPTEAVLFPVHTADGVLHFCRPADPEAILNRLSGRDFDRDEQLPYWAEHWPAADVAAEYLSSQSLEPATSACEVGCGLGVVTTILARRCALVAGMDISLEGCRYAALNLRTHDCAPLVVCGDWRASPFRACFDLVVGVDLLYEERWVESVAQFLWNTVAPGGMAIVADPCRAHWEAFRERCRELGFTCALAARRVVNQGRTCVEVLRMIR